MPVPKVSSSSSTGNKRRREAQLLEQQPPTANKNRSASVSCDDKTLATRPVSNRQHDQPTTTMSRKHIQSHDKKPAVKPPPPEASHRPATNYATIHEPIGDERRRLEDYQSMAVDPIWLPHTDSHGIGTLIVPRQHAHALQELHTRLTNRLQGVPWGEGQEDPIRRMYGFLPGQRQRLIEAGIRIQKESAKDHHEHQQAMQDSASMDLDPLDASIWDALSAITDMVHALVPRHYQRFVTVDQLVAVQPNQHHGATHLPLHLDFPRHDGFGVVIVTLVMQARAADVIVVVDEGDTDDDVPQAWSFSVPPLQGYILCGHARNKCLHGVVCQDTVVSHRESLNLRYGLHSEAYAQEEIDRHWPE